MAVVVTVAVAAVVVAVVAAVVTAAAPTHATPRTLVFASALVDREDANVGLG